MNRFISLIISCLALTINAQNIKIDKLNESLKKYTATKSQNKLGIVSYHNKLYKLSIDSLDLVINYKVEGSGETECKRINLRNINKDEIKNKNLYSSNNFKIYYLDKHNSLQYYSVFYNKKGSTEVYNDFLEFFDTIDDIIKNNDEKSILTLIKKYIETGIQQWQKKGRYEKTEDYLERVNETTREKKALELSEIAINEIAKKQVDLSNPKIDYDADNESFRIVFEKLNPIYINVPIAEAKSFDENIRKIEYNNFKFTITPKNNFAICHLQVKNPSINKIYTYDSKESTTFNMTQLDLNFGELNIELQKNEIPTIDETTTTLRIGKSDVDINIPVTTAVNSKTFAVIIGNENYQQVSKVTFANNDAETFASYCQKTLGLPANNVRVYKNATYGTMLSAVKDIQSIADAYKGDINVIFYYAGHGVPAEDTKEAYLLPVDADGSQPEVCYPLTRLYKNLEDLKAKSTYVFLDACFSGAQRGDGMLASARGVAIKVRQDVPQGNMVVFSAATGEETAYPYKEKGHGLFTYFLLKELQQTKGNVTLGELSNYVTTNVSQQSIVVNRKSQTPTVVPSANIGDKWMSVVLK